MIFEYFRIKIGETIGVFDAKHCWILQKVDQNNDF
jgi:hypothetical protein